MLTTKSLYLKVEALGKIILGLSLQVETVRSSETPTEASNPKQASESEVEVKSEG